VYDDDDDVCDGWRYRTRRSWSAGSQMRQRQVTDTAAAAAAAAGRPISVRFCESPANSHSLTSFTELTARPSSRPPAFDHVEITTPSVLSSRSSTQRARIFYR